jgi:hypothetical protein
MSARSRLDGLERQLGLVLCPHCGGALRPTGESDVPHTPDEQYQLLRSVFVHLYSRERLLELLAACAPEVRDSVRDVHPLPAEVGARNG